jgi:protein YIPF1/2
VDPNARGNKIQPDTSAGFLPGGSSRSTGGGSSKSFLWNISFYAQYFDVDTNEVLKRCFAAVVPQANFLDVLEGNPDLYGPVWIATTVVLILFLSGTINEYLALHGKKHFEYDFKLLSGMWFTLGLKLSGRDACG